MPRNRPEAILERQVLATLGTDRNLAIFRNECGEGFYANVWPQLRALLAGHPAAEQAMAILDRNRVHYGLHNGSADLCGLIGPAGRFVSFELKSEAGALRPDQILWQARMRELGALAEVVRSPGQASLYIDEARRGQR